MPSKARLLAKSMIESPILSEITTNPTITPSTITTAVNDVATGSFATVDLLPNTGNDVGDQAFVQATNRLYIWSGTGWYNIALINTTPTWDSNGQPAATYELSADSPQTATTITLAASDPEGFPITYSHVTGGSMDSIATVSQDSSVFTVTPKTSTQAPDGGTGSITFRASDGINILPYVSSFTLSFIFIIDDSKYTTLLATADGTSDNNNITDSSTNNHSITVNGDAYAGTFSPYRHGGYSAYFGTGGSERITIEGTKSTLAGANADFSIGAWIYPTAGNDKWIYSTNVSNNNQAGWHDLYLEGSTKLVWRHSDGSTHRSMMSTNPVSLNEWSYILINRTSNVTYMYINGSLVVQNSDMTYALYTHTNAPSIGIRRFYDNGTTGLDFEGYITDVHVKTAAISSPTTVPTERAVADSDTWLLTAHLPYFGDGSSNNYTVSAYNNVSTKPYTQYDNLEYASADHGGSVFIEANGGHLSGTLSSGGLGTTFTVEMWIYDDGTGGNTTYGGYFTTTDIGSQYGIQLRRYGAYIFNSTTGTNLTWNANGDPFATIFGIGWHHVAAVHNGSTFKVYVDGKEVISTSDSHTYSSVNYKVGQPWLYQSDGSQQAKAYISDLRINKSAIYSGEFTPPTAPLSSTGTELHIKGTDASIIDKSQNGNLKMFGNTTGSTTQVKFAGSKSMYCAGSLHDKVIAYAARDVDIPNNGEYTFEAWCYFNSVSGVIHMLSSGDVTNRIAFELRNSKLAAMVGGSVIQSGSQVLSTGQWYHLAISRVTGSPYSTTRFFVNGNLDQTATNYQQSFAIGGFNEWIIGSPSPNNIGNGYNEVTGYMQDVRFTEGLVRYTANFTPPTKSLEG